MYILAGLMVLAIVGIVVILWRKNALQRKQKGVYKKEVLRQRKEELINSGTDDFSRTVHLWDSKKLGSANVYVFLQDIRNENVSFRAELEVFVDVGRTEGDIVISTDSSLSRKHCRIIKRDNDLYLVDLGSSNGTVYDGERIIKETPIVEGKILEIGRQQFKLEIVEGQYELKRSK